MASRYSDRLDAMMAKADREAAQEVLLRSASVDDLTEIMTIECVSYSAPWHVETMRGELRGVGRGKIYLVAEIEGHLVGYIGSHYFAGEVHILTVAVAPYFRRLGIGELLVLSLLLKVIDLGGEYATLEYRVTNEPAERLYRKLGFAAVTVRPGYYLDNKEDAIVAEIADLDDAERQAELRALLTDWKARHGYEVTTEL
jgi:[ribosomal protein S18]-alanine N-acetyltransferase